jgi:arginine exporter protein ArgO
VILVVAALFQADRQNNGQYLLLAMLFAVGAAFLFWWGARLDRAGR